MTRLAFLLLTLAFAGPAFADDDAPEDARPLAPEAALACAAGRYRGEALALRDREDGRIQEIRWLTPAGNMLKIRLTGPGCRFLDVEGVGQTQARIPPKETPPKETPPGEAP